MRDKQYAVAVAIRLFLVSYVYLGWWVDLYSCTPPYQWRLLVLCVMAYLLHRLHPPQIRPLPLRPLPLHPLHRPLHPPLHHLCLPRSTRQAVTLRRLRVVVNGRDAVTMTTDPTRLSSIQTQTQTQKTGPTFPAVTPFITNCRANTPAQVIVIIIT